MRSVLSATPAVLTVEIDTQWIRRGNRPPPPLGRDAAEVVAAAVANDLRRILGDEVMEAGLVVAAALYDTTELLRPGLPMAEMMLDVYRDSLRGGEFEANLLALGTAGGRFPVPELAPERRAHSGPLLALPWALVAPGEILERVRRRLESELLRQGAASLSTDRAVRQHFGVEPLHLTYASFHDLSALMRVQLEHAGFGPLWTLIEAALYRPDETTAAALDAGNRFLTHQGKVWTPSMGFTDWAERHRQSADAASGYAEHVRLQRQYTAGLAAHGLEIRPVCPQAAVFDNTAREALRTAQAHELEDPQRWSEVIAGDPRSFSAAVVTLTEQADPALGPLAYTVLAQHEDGSLALLLHEYPLSPQAVAQIREQWRQRAHAAGASFHIEEPGHLIVGGDPPGFLPYLDYAGGVQ